MATTTTHANICVICEKQKETHDCKGCQLHFCINHLLEHRQQLDHELDEIINRRDEFNQNLSETKQEERSHSIIEQINQWEEKSIDIIKQTANETRQSVKQLLMQHVENVEVDLKKITEQVKVFQQEKDFNEIHLNKLKNQLDLLKQQLNQYEIRENSTLIKKIEVHFVKKMLTPTGITIVGGNGNGSELNQLNKPTGICVDDHQTIYVVDLNNHRIVKWKKGATNGRVVAGGNGKGNASNQLNAPVDMIIDYHSDTFIIADRGNQRVVQWPRRNAQKGRTIISNIDCRSLAMNNFGDLYVVDLEKYEVRRWKVGEKQGALVAGGNGKGAGLNQLNGPRGIVVDGNESIYIADCANHRVVKWLKGAKEGIVVAGGQTSGASLKQLAHPREIFVDKAETVYVADYGNNRIVRWLKGSSEGELELDQLNKPNDIFCDEYNNLYVVENGNNRIQKFIF